MCSDALESRRVLGTGVCVAILSSYRFALVIRTILFLFG